MASPVNNGAEALMALNTSAETRVMDSMEAAGPNPTLVAKLTGEDFEHFMWNDKAVIGRNSSHGQVDVNIGLSSYVSRKHLQIFRERNRYFLKCLGKNGVFVDGQFQRLGAEPLALKPTCTIRFPSTNIRIHFSVVKTPEAEKQSETNGKHAAENEKPPMVYQDQPFVPRVPSEDTIKLEPITNITPLSKPPILMHQSAPTFLNQYANKAFFSAPPSPTGTISAANSCPASPKGGTSHLNITDNLKMAAAYAAKVVQERGEVIEVPNPGEESPPRDDHKPPYSYAQLIIQAISSSKNKHLTLSGIYAHITKHYPYYRTADKGWQNSIRHNLSLNRYFVKVPRSQEESGKGSFWRIDPASEHKLVDQAWKKRRQRGVPCFRPPLGNISATRSAPASPVHSNPISPQPQSQEMPAVSQPPPPPMQQHTLLREKEQKVQFMQVPRYAQSAPGSPATLAPSPMTNATVVAATGGAIGTLPTIHPQTQAIINANQMPVVTAVGKVIWPMEVAKPQGYAVAPVIKPINSNGVASNEGVIRATNVQTDPQKLSIVMPQQQVVMVAGQTPGAQPYPVSLGTIITPAHMPMAQPIPQGAPVLMKRQYPQEAALVAEDVKRMKTEENNNRQGGVQVETE